MIRAALWLVAALAIPAVLAAAAAAPTARTTKIRAGQSPGSVAIADVNGDGKPDVVVANEKSDDVSVLLGNGKGGFTPAPGSPFAAGKTPNDLAVADFDKDGKLDIAMPNHDTDHVTLLLGDGKGGFRPAPRSPIRVRSRPHPHGVAAGDFDGDGKMDLAVESWGEDRVEVLFGDGAGGFAVPRGTFAVGRMPYQRLRAADVNGDGRADILTTNFEGGSVSVLLGAADRALKPAPGSPFAAGAHPFAFTIADLDRDGRLDLAVAGYSGHSTDASADGAHVLLGDGRGAFRLAGSHPTGRAPIGIAAGDLDGDGRVEIVTVNTAGDSITVLRGSERGFTALPPKAVGGGPECVAVGDLNGDRKADIVVCATKDDAIDVLLSE